MGFPQEYWNGLPSSPPADLPDPGNETCTTGDSLQLSHLGSLAVETSELIFLILDPDG